MAKTRVGIIRGGPSSEYDISLQTGRVVLENLPTHYEPIDILITKDGAWHIGGLPISPEQLKRKVDVVFNALHGEYGEDGQVQQILERFGLPYTGSDRFSSSLAMNKHISKSLAKKHGIKTPNFILVKKGESPSDAAHKTFNSFAPPWVVKPANRGSSVGLYFTRHFNELVEAIQSTLLVSDLVLIEEYISGKEATCGVIDDFRGTRNYTLPSIEIRPPKNKKLFDYEAKYSGISEEICPGCFTDSEKKELQNLAVQIHNILGLRHYSRSDFIVSNRGIYFLEANALPGLTEESLFPKALRAIGSNHGQFFDHILMSALNKGLVPSSD